MIHKVKQVSSEIAEQLCRNITKDLPEYFGLPDCNEHYAIGVRSRVNFAAIVEENFVGLLSLEFPYPTNSNIYWMGILRKFQTQGIGALLTHEAFNCAKQHGATTMTVETLAPDESDQNYLKTYQFYEKMGFKPLFNLKPQNYEWNMVYMAANLLDVASDVNRDGIIIRHFTSEDIPMIVHHFAKHNWIKPQSTFETYFQEQSENERMIWLAFYENQFAGYITLKWESLYSPFREKNIPEIMDLNVLPPHRSKGVGSTLLITAENEARKRFDIVGIGVGLYKDYGSAQKLYVRKGYMPDGLGVTYNYNSVEPGKNVILDDDLVLWFTKRLK